MAARPFRQARGAPQTIRQAEWIVRVPGCARCLAQNSDRSVSAISAGGGIGSARRGTSVRRTSAAPWRVRRRLSGTRRPIGSGAGRWRSRRQRQWSCRHSRNPVTPGHTPASAASAPVPWLSGCVTPFGGRSCGYLVRFRNLIVRPLSRIEVDPSQRSAKQQKRGYDSGKDHDRGRCHGELRPLSRCRALMVSSFGQYSGQRAPCGRSSSSWVQSVLLRQSEQQR